MNGWRAVDQEPVASRQAVAAGMLAVVEAVEAYAAEGRRVVVAACWQDAAYLDVPPGVLERLAAVGELTVSCSGRPRLPDGVCHVPMEPDEAAAAEWSVVALAGDAGISLVAREVGASLPATTVERGRAFRYDASSDPRIVTSHARRLLRVFGARMTPLAAAGFAEAATTYDTTAQQPTVDLGEELEQVVEHTDEHRRAGAVTPPPTSDLAQLAGWLADAGPRAPALGVVVARSGVRGVATVLREHAHAIGRVGDLVVDVPPDAAMIVLPGLAGAALDTRADEVQALLADALVTGDVHVTSVELPAARARVDLVGCLGAALAELRTTSDRTTAAG